MGMYQAYSSRITHKLNSVPTPSQITPYKGFDFNAFSPSVPSNGVNPPEGLIPFDPSPYHLEQSWQAAEDIEKDVNSVNSNIDSLMVTLGLNPSLLTSNENSGNGTTGLDPMMLDPNVLSTGGAPTQPAGPDDFFNTYLYSMNDGPNDESLDFGASSTMVPPSPADSTSNTDSPDSTTANPAILATITKGRKRKSESGGTPTDIAMKSYVPPNARNKKQKK
ncbi:hypothetical protein MPER_09502 [Moniliophthora perniciosa FA553]|nr:hypothetical protein MPER_09502 [Moniliophthora perniciosa FA553]